jgi:hypothetical protein
MQGGESLSEIGTSCLLQFVLTSAHRLRDNELDLIVEQLDQITTANAKLLTQVC